MKRILLLLLLLLISNVSALCNETQIDINTASKEELDKIIWIGPSTADKIISYRQNNLFNSIDELINVSGIGEIKLNDIKEQGLACVSEENEIFINKTIENEENTSEATQNNTETNQSSETIQTSTEKQSKDSKDYKSITLETITLQTGKDIKSEDSKIKLNKSNYAIYGFIAFCILLGILFLVKKIKKPYKSEFD